MIMKGLKAIRKLRHLNQQKVAMDLNITRECLSYYENGKRSPDIEMLCKLSDYYNVSIDYLIKGEDSNLHSSEAKYNNDCLRNK